MALSLAPLLIHSEAVPPAAREALGALAHTPPEQRRAGLEHAARVLFYETDLDCTDARELVGLETGVCE